MQDCRGRVRQQQTTSVGLVQRLKARCQVHGITVHRVGETTLGADRAGDHRSGIDADPMLDAVSGEGMLANHSLHLNGRAQCIGSVIGVAHRNIEGCPVWHRPGTGLRLPGGVRGSSPWLRSRR